MKEKTAHKHLNNGIEFVCATIPNRRVVAVEFRVLAGAAHEPPDRLGLAHVTEEAISKGTANFDAKGLSDAFDAIGASHASWTERESTRFVSMALPEYAERAVELHAEFLRSPTFPEDFVDVAVQLGHQELQAQEDDPASLADRLIGEQAYGAILGRHPLGTRESLDRITRDDARRFWEAHYHGGRMQVAIAGPIDAETAAGWLERCFDGFGPTDPAGREQQPVRFDPVRTHHEKETEQEQILIGFQGVPRNHPQRPVQRVILGVLSGGMSARLFTEVREKQGLVYGIGAYDDYPRGVGTIFVEAASRTDHCERCYATILRELDRLREDITPDEVERALTQIEVTVVFRNDRTKDRCADLSDDLFHYGRPVPVDEKLTWFKGVTLDDIRRYQEEYPWRPLSVITLGPRKFDLGAAD